MKWPRRAPIRSRLPAKVKQPHAVTAADHDVAVGAVKGRAGDDDGASLFPPAVDAGGDARQPRRAVGVAERRADAHILATFSGGCSTSPSWKAQPNRWARRAATVVLPRPGHPHDHDDQSAVVSLFPVH